jgi:hypothetical protein
MKNPAQTGSGCIRFNDLNFHQATFAGYSGPIRLKVYIYTIGLGTSFYNLLVLLHANTLKA